MKKQEKNSSLQKNNPSSTYASVIRKSLEEVRTDLLVRYSDVNPWSKKAINLLFDFAVSGKLLRGSLFLDTYTLFSKLQPSENELKIACCLELIQSALLIHDDIMDSDILRRGGKTMTKFLADTTDNEKHTGDSLAICVGDFAFFVAIELTADSNPQIIKKIASEIASVGLGQMQDVYPQGDITKDTILSLYTYKTARYTVSLPLSLGAIMTDQNENVITKLENIGQDLGVLFQIEDDYIDVFSDEKISGKDAGSDIREDKLTILKALLLEKKETPDINRALSYFGNKNINQKNIDDIKNILSKTGIVSEIDMLKQAIITGVTKKMEDKVFTAPQSNFLVSLMSTLLNRSS